MTGYFIDEDAHGELCVWRRTDTPRPVCVLGQHDLHDDPELWDAIVAVVETTPTRLAAIEALVDRWEREGAARGSDDTLLTSGVVAMLRAALAAEQKVSAVEALVAEWEREGRAWPSGFDFRAALREPTP